LCLRPGWRSKFHVKHPLPPISPKDNIVVHRAGSIT